MIEKSKDKRYFSRVAISLNGSVKDGNKRVVFKIIDLTVEGISFQLQHYLPAGAKIIIDLNGTEDIRRNELKAEILRCDPLKNIFPAQYVAAAKFMDANDEYLMDALALVHGKRKRNK